MASQPAQTPAVRIQIVERLAAGVAREAVEGLVGITFVIVWIVLPLFLLLLPLRMVSFTGFAPNVRLEPILSLEPCGAVLTLMLFPPFPLTLRMSLRSAHRLEVRIPGHGPLEGSTAMFT